MKKYRIIFLDEWIPNKGNAIENISFWNNKCNLSKNMFDKKPQQQWIKARKKINWRYKTEKK